MAICVQQSYDPTGLASSYTGVQNLARGSISSLAATQLEQNSSSNSTAASSAAGAAQLAFYSIAGAAPKGFDKRVATLVTCCLDVVSMLAVLGALFRFSRLEQRIQNAEDVRRKPPHCLSLRTQTATICAAITPRCCAAAGPAW